MSPQPKFFLAMPLPDLCSHHGMFGGLSCQTLVLYCIFQCSRYFKGKGEGEGRVGDVCGGEEILNSYESH